MIINNLLFIHIPKNSGTSVEYILDKQYNTNNSLFYRFFTENTNSFIKYVLFNKSHFCFKYLNTLLNYIKYILSNKSLLYNSIYYHTFPIHYKASYINSLYSNYIECISFTVIRNPYTRAVSLFCYTHPEQWINLENFNIFLNKLLNKELQSYTTFFDSQLSYILDEKKSEQLVKETLRFENLDEDWIIFSNKYNLNLSNLPRLNVKKSSNITNNLLNTTTREKIYIIYKEDFEYFKYDI